MARVPITLPGQDSSYEFPVAGAAISGFSSRLRAFRKSPGVLINMMVENNNNGQFSAIIKREGTEVIYDNAGENILSDFFLFESQASVYFADSTNAYLAGFGFDNVFTVSQSTPHQIPIPVGVTQSEIGVVGYSVGGMAQVFFYRKLSGGASIFEGTFLSPTVITNTTYTNGVNDSGQFINSRLFFVNTATGSAITAGRAFGSAPLDGTVYDPLVSGSPSETPGRLLAIRGYKSSLYMFTSDNIEVWQTRDDTFPFAPILGASHRVGLYSADAIDQLKDYIGFVGNDLNVYMLFGSQLTRISDFNYTTKINPFSLSDIGSPDRIPNIRCSFVETVEHKYFVVTRFNFNFFPSTAEDSAKNFTWIYDLKTNTSHLRETAGLNYWNCYFTRMIATSRGAIGGIMTFSKAVNNLRTDEGVDKDKIFRISNELLNDNGADFNCVIESSSLSFDQDVVIEYIELEMETGVGTNETPDPVMTVSYSKDGGVNYTEWGDVNLGGMNDTSNRIRMNNFGRLIRHRDFKIKLELQQSVAFIVYGAYAEITGGF